MRKTTADETEPSDIKIIWGKKPTPEMDLTFK